MPVRRSHSTLAAATSNALTSVISGKEIVTVLTSFSVFQLSHNLRFEVTTTSM